MQYQDNNMDDLFRRAAENYPLKTGESNWDKIAPALQSGTAVPVVTSKRNSTQKTFKKILPVLLLLMTGGASTIFILTSKKETGIYQPSNIEQPVKPQNVGIKNNKHGIVLTENNSAKEENILQDSNEFNNRFPRIRNINIINPVLRVIEKKGPYNQQQADLAYIPVNSSVQIINTSPDKNIELVNKAKVATNNITTDNEATNNQQPTASVPQKENRLTAAPVTVIKHKSKKLKGLYAGIVIGTGFSEVKNQGLTKPGLEGGIRAGYRFNNKLSVETGIILSKKYYYSDGEYFKMNKISSSMPSGMQVLSLSGSSTVIEIAVKVKYNIPVNSKGNLFTTAGLSSYIMTKEKNNYLALVNGNKQNITSTYSKSNRYLAAVIDFSVGYEFNIQKNKALRIEPYLQFPLKGIGVGTMPVMSTGLHIGYTLFKH